jgi:hypothetical protein
MLPPVLLMVAAITGRMNLLNTTLATFSLGPYSNANWNRTTSRLYGRLGSWKVSVEMFQTMRTPIRNRFLADVNVKETLPISP